MESLSSHNVYKYQSSGRFIEDSNGKVGVVRDVYTAGLEQLLTSITSYNEQFRSIQADRSLSSFAFFLSTTSTLLENNYSTCLLLYR